MKRINEKQFQELTAGAEILITSPKSKHPMVVRSSDGLIIKRLEFKDKFTSKKFNRARRFKVNSEKLLKLGFTTPIVRNLYQWGEENCHVIVYQAVPGEEVSQYLDREEISDEQKQKTFLDVAGYYAQMHNCGIYCRPTHFRNILVDEHQQLGLIDVHNIRFSYLSLSSWVRARNFKHIFSHKKDLEQLKRFGASEFFKQYATTAGLSKVNNALFKLLLKANSKEISSALSCS